MLKNLFLIFCFILLNISTFSQDEEYNIRRGFNLNNEQLEAYKEGTKDKLNSLENCLKTIGSKSSSEIKKSRSVETAISLFIKGSKIEVSSLNRNTVNKTLVEDYFEELQNLPYTKVEISFYNLSYVSNFVQSSDGSYVATATVFQRFVAYKGDFIVYQDKTKKQISVKLRWLKDPIFGKYRWTILFHDMRVSETKENK